MTNRAYQLAGLRYAHRNQTGHMRAGVRQIYHLLLTHRRPRDRDEAQHNLDMMTLIDQVNHARPR